MSECVSAVAHLLGGGAWASLLSLQLLQLGVEGCNLGLVLETQLRQLGLAHTHLSLSKDRTNSHSR